MGYQAIQGATTVGLICSDGVVLASEKRVTYGRLVASTKGQKVFKLTENVGLAFAGLMSDMQALVREAEAYANLFYLEKNRPITTKAMAKLISNMLFNRRMMPLLMETVVGGYDADGPSLYSMDPVGSLIPDDFLAAGSGAAIAIGVLEAEYKKELDCEAGVELARKSIKSAIARDAMSGDGIDILIIKAGGSEIRTESFRS
ncbi:archaeal proteasome endopeptidase complex subunit beta [Candidatus Bathyarchaeota archaeon]|jgi:proteasome beta subunit|nr:archaeal proteasome endopeptidase complex subunit beta [Candidatus Bathyarchaeota archaeon]MCJ7732718.1 archaeal proteasome endopeptidase complex subunit beta [Candidatus Bathyarchaeota archaeon]TFH16412.1 MAG: archaeal proteasome endopeptidase complex subunit beta [Candidatus Bathyarchaeota archaeon]